MAPCTTDVVTAAASCTVDTAFPVAACANEPGTAGRSSATAAGPVDDRIGESLGSEGSSGSAKASTGPTAFSAGATAGPATATTGWITAVVPADAGAAAFDQRCRGLQHGAALSSRVR